MSAEEIQSLITIAKDVGFPFLAGVFALVIIYMMVKSTVKKADSQTDMGLSAHKELIRLREHEQGIVEDRLELERKFTECREALAKANGYIALIESKQQTAVQDFLDDTHNFDRELDMKDKEILRLTGKLADIEAIVAAKDAMLMDRDATIKKLIDEKFQ